MLGNLRKMTDRIALAFAKSGLILSKVPFSFQKATEFLGCLLMSIPNSRRRLLISNLMHAFPKWEYKSSEVARESSARIFEMGFSRSAILIYQRTNLGIPYFMT